MAEKAGKREKILKEKCANPSCNYWHPPVCLNYKPESGCKFGDQCLFRHAAADGQPSEKSKKSGGKGSVALLKESIQLVCVSQDSHPKKSILRAVGKLGSNHTIKFSKGTWHHKKNRERKGPARNRTHKFEDRTHQETLQQERCTLREAKDLAKNVHKLAKSTWLRCTCLQKYG